MAMDESNPKRSDFPCPMIIRPFEPYRSVVTGEMITDRSQRREEIRRGRDRNLEPWEPSPDRPQGFINENFCKRGGLPVSEEAQEWAAREKKKAEVKRDDHGNIIVE